MTTTLRDYQRSAIDTWRTVTTHGGSRASMILPTGTGKTVVAAHLLPDGHKARVVFFVPTVVLLEQTCRHLAAAQPAMRLLPVCSPTAPALDDAADETYTESQVAAREHITATTDPDTIAEHLRAPGPAALVATYASSPAVAAAAESTGTVFDLSICDEAHRTAGAPDKAWALPVRDEFPARQRLFMTATARTITVPTTPAATAAMAEIGWDEADVISMDSLETYGPHISPLSFRDAIDAGYLSDYNIAVIGITSHQARQHLRNLLADTSTNYTLTDAAAHLALARATSTHPHIHSVLAFHNRIAASQLWTDRLPGVYSAISGTVPARLIEAVHIDGATTPQDRDAALTDLANPGDRLCVVSNCRVFSEGVDVPALDAVLFAAPRTAGPDIVQIVGRAIRPHPNGAHHKALIIVPVLLASDADDSAADLAAARTSHLAAWRILTSLADQDELLHQSLLTWRSTTHDQDDTPRNGPLEIDIPEGLDLIAREVFLRTIDRTVPTHLRTAAYLRDYYAVHGHANPRSSATFRRFPIGTAVRAARAAHRSRSLPARIVAEFDEIPGFAWSTGQSPAQRSADDWISLIKHYVTKTGIHTIDRSSFVTDPATGASARIGQWYHTKARRKNYLTNTEQQRLAEILKA